MATKLRAAIPASAPEPTISDTAPDTHDAVTDYDPVTLHRQRHDGWTAERQRIS